MGMEDYSTPVEALRFLDKLYPDLGVMNPEARTRSEYVGRYFGYMSKVTDEDHKRLLESDRFMGWIKNKRGFSDVAIKKFRLGIREFSGIPRLTIPQESQRGRVLATLSRRMSPKDTLPRYFVRNVSLRPTDGQIVRKSDGIVENEIPVFKKGSYLYGYDDVAGSSIILVEGQLDRIASWELGVDNVSAYGTMRISKEQSEMLSQFRSVTLIPDLGSALDFVIDNVETIRESNPMLPIAIVDLSSWAGCVVPSDEEEDRHVKDINDLLLYLTAEKDFAAFKKAVKKAVPVEDWLYDKYVDSSNVNSALVEMQRLLKLATAPVPRVALVSKAASDLCLPADLLMAAR
jgi:hypothetical protein